MTDTIIVKNNVLLLPFPEPGLTNMTDNNGSEKMVVIHDTEAERNFIQHINSFMGPTDYRRSVQRPSSFITKQTAAESKRDMHF